MEKHGKRNWETDKNRNSHTSKIVCILLVCLINNRHLADHISEPYAKLTYVRMYVLKENLRPTLLGQLRRVDLINSDTYARPPHNRPEMSKMAPRAAPW